MGRADDVGLDEVGRAADRPVDMALGGEMHHRIRAGLGENTVECRPVANVRPFEAIARIAGHRIERGQAGGVGELVEVDDFVAEIVE